MAALRQVRRAEGRGDTGPVIPSAPLWREESAVSPQGQDRIPRPSRRARDDRPRNVPVFCRCQSARGDAQRRTFPAEISP